MNFRFSEEGLRAALEAEGADMNSFGMSVSHQPIKGLEAPRPENEWEAYRYMKPNKVYNSKFELSANHNDYQAL